MKLPSRINELPEEERPLAALRFHLAVAAAHASDAATLTGLAKAIGFNRQYMGNIWRGTDCMSIKVAIAIEKAVGRDVVTRADLLPAVFEYEVSNVE